MGTTPQHVSWTSQVRLSVHKNLDGRAPAPGLAQDDLAQSIAPARCAAPAGWDPSYAEIAAKAGVCVRTVASALKRLREPGILNWVRRCAESWRDGRFVLEQETNAYGLLPESQWRGYRRHQDTWGDPPPTLSAIA